ncbi:hypothetical protein like AT4G00872 [Hibiscus trionum]|uniref:Pectinesterase inhibitor domain-containing protein n=1 Tax=Hibiscus trionum TaxID=183268 RepID=A0A9W7LIK6_HIBTR|nr:hypothetical protein like AT4G00872 [Hibiscus trionum]
MGIVLLLYHLGLFLLLISFIYVEHRNLVFADETLIELQCHNAEVPSTCIQCVKSDPRGQLADNVAIAGIVIYCLRNNARALSGNMTALASATLDKDVKRAMQSCEKGMKTNSLVKKGLQQKVDCRKNVWDYRALIPDCVIYDMRVYEELSDAATRIIDRF